MEPGFQVDSPGRGVFRQGTWAPGPPQAKEGTLLGMKLFEEWVLELKEEDLRPVVGLRCTACGFLEYYAP